MVSETERDAQPETAETAALAFHRTVQQYEHHFNSMEFEVRKLASAWLLVAFGAIAFIARGGLQEGQPLLDLGPSLVLVAALAQIGLFTLWILDQVVYHGLLDAVFTLALYVEQRDPRLPPLRSMMMRISGGSGMARYNVLFYLIPMLVLALIAWGGGVMAVDQSRAETWAWLAPAAIASALPVWVVVKSKLIADAQIENRPAQEVPGLAAYESVLMRWLGPRR